MRFDPDYFSRNHDFKRKKELILYSLSFFVIGLILGGAGSIYLFINITGGSAAPSQPVSAPTLSVDSFIAEADISPTEGSSEAPATITQENEVSVSDTSIPISSLPPTLFRIVPIESQARFSVYETFPEGTAVGRTGEIAGDIIIDFLTPSNSQLGAIRINLRTLRTDDPDRDSSIRCCVLLTGRDEYEFTDFVPVSISQLPETLAYGQVVNFNITGNLTLRGNTRPAIFNVELTIVNPDQVIGFATATVNRSDFGILNDADNGFDYHGVEEEVLLEFEFVARSVNK